MLKRPVFLACAALMAAFSLSAQDYKLEPVTSAPAGLPAPYASLIDTHGYRINGPKGAWVEVWFRKSISAGPKSADDAVALPIAQGMLLGVLRFPSEGY